MATYTEYLGLTKPAQTETYDVDVFNSNSDLLDTFAKNVQTHMENKNNPHEVTAEQIGAALEAVLNAHTTDTNIHTTAGEKANIASSLAITQTTLGVQCINLFNQDGEINNLPSGNVSTSNVNTVDGSTITFNRNTNTQSATGQIISGLSGKTVIVSGTCVSVGTSSSGLGTMIMYIIGDTTKRNRQEFGVGDFSYTISCGDTDEWLFGFAVSGSGSGLQIENLMIRFAEISDGTYHTYTPSLQAQLDALTARIAALEGGTES